MWVKFLNIEKNINNDSELDSIRVNQNKYFWII